jgi:crotonobetainyl-CoA:carnitine CoA-transferase CaiB-like acyl-CoA transferase
VAHGCGWAEPSPSAPAAAPAAPGALGVPRPADPPLAGVVVLDLTATWAGPLCTWVLAALGADVRKVEPACRLDGFRGLAGGGITPGGDGDPGRGDRSALFNALNRGKARLDLDLRRPADHAALLGQAAGADLVVDSFSPRVHEQLGTGREVLAAGRPDLCTLSIPAFPPGDPRRSWVAYGGGVHAASGLADLGDGEVAVPVVSYPDPIAGLSAAATAVALLVARRLGWAPVHVEVPLLSATLPLLRWPLDPAAWTTGPAGAPPGADPGPALLGDPALLRRGALRELADGAGTHRYPRAPISGPGTPVPDAPAPPLPGSVPT